MAVGSGCYIHPYPGYPRGCALCATSRPVACRAHYCGGLLVHIIDFVREPSRDVGARLHHDLFWHCDQSCTGLCRDAVGRGCGSRCGLCVALFGFLRALRRKPATSEWIKCDCQTALNDRDPDVAVPPNYFGDYHETSPSNFSASDCGRRRAPGRIADRDGADHLSVAAGAFEAAMWALKPTDEAYMLPLICEGAWR
jgi:hypothetical protein